ncbi:DEAD-domain-containing protein [Gloeophyllum trabeum ATCC 11539]|uniref:ATP-dependent RNA helicase n=1 Tax=Gloeophyllum trabeum (strain ATCC 11539 / FP-39264 / Madison 617) TaxID=670483 RepID=S7Q3N2_GLOTA|nr:DEAD-domain-containing protein [Gloeophyllum trabeum ATCC 11539]EPQ54018.1 DEAD-domain-containing protein [Gloeophyllum trabeum ATCC 11539]
MPYDPPRDVCVSAPTGSGKTLAYVLPIVEILSTRIVTRLRALVVLPTRDLVTQVRETFEAVGKGRGLKIGTATGHHSFAHEQSQLVADKSLELQGGSSKVDILICTPGRLIDHLHGTPNFSLQHLRFLVVDEADRLLAQSFQDWLAEVLAAVRPPPNPLPLPVISSALLPYPDALAPSFLHPHIPTDLDETKEPSCQKLLFSATLTSDPGKLKALGLREAKYFVVRSADGEQEGVAEGVAMEKFTMPATLREHMIVCESALKPLMLLYLIHHHGVKNALVFTKSAESTARLVRLVEFFEDAWAKGQGDRRARKIVARAYSSDLPPGERRGILEQFRKGEVDMLVASDLISRGIDISSVSHVVSYDVPVDMRKYVHRVGRTARAGREGDAWTLVEEQEARYFKSILKAANHLERVKRMRVSEKDTQDLSPFYDTALARLREVFSRAS